MRMLNTRISCRTWKIHTTNDPTFIGSVEEKIYMKPCTMQSWGFPVFLWTQWLKTPLMMVHPHFLVCWIPIRVQFFFRKMTMFVDEFLLCWLHPQFCVSTWSKTDGTDIEEWSTMTEYHGICTIFSNCWFPVFSGSQFPPCSSTRTSTSDWSLSVDLRACSWGDWSVESSAADAAFNARHEKCFPYIPLFNPI